MADGMNEFIKAFELEIKNLQDLCRTVSQSKMALYKDIKNKIQNFITFVDAADSNRTSSH
jgi:hypothetical protein